MMTRLWVLYRSLRGIYAATERAMLQYWHAATTDSPASRHASAYLYDTVVPACLPWL